MEPRSTGKVDVCSYSMLGTQVYLVEEVAPEGSWNGTQV